MSWSLIVSYAFNILVFPGFLTTLVIGCLLSWLYRKLTARLQGRVGPPFWQPYLDLLKLLGKRAVLPSLSSSKMIMLASFFSLACVCVVASILPFGCVPPLSFTGDLLIVFYFLVMPTFMLALIGSLSGNPFGAMGTKRLLSQILSFEFPLIIAILTVAVRTGLLSLVGIALWQKENGILILHPSGFLAALVYFMCLPAKLWFGPWDIPNAKQEIIDGPLTEIGGPLLALLDISHFMEYTVSCILFINLFLGGLIGPFALTFKTLSSLLAYLFGCIVLITLLTLLDAATARLKITSCFKFYWMIVLPLAIVSLGLAFVEIILWRV